MDECVQWVRELTTQCQLFLSGRILKGMDYHYFCTPIASAVPGIEQMLTKYLKEMNMELEISGICSQWWVVSFHLVGCPLND